MVWPIPDSASTKDAACWSLATARRAECPRSFAIIGECFTRVASGEPKVQIAKVFALSEAAAAHAHIEGRHAFGRVVMTAA